MKAATGELNLTIITIIAIGAILAFFTAVLWPQIKGAINGDFGNATNNTIDTGYVEVVHSDLI